MSSLIPVEFPQNSMVGPQRHQISKLQFDKFPDPHSYSVWKIRLIRQVTTCSDFPSDAMLWIKEVEMVDFIGRIVLAISLWKEFSKFRDAIASVLNKIIQNSQFKKKVSLEAQ